MIFGVTYAQWQKSYGRQRSRNGEAPRETGYVIYVLALLFTEFLDDKSRLCDLLKNDKSRLYDLWKN